jgi:hypothetical protein
MLQAARSPRPDEVNDFFPVYLIIPAALGPGVYSASIRNEYQKQKNVCLVGSADSLTSICMPIV